LLDELSVVLFVLAAGCGDDTAEIRPDASSPASAAAASRSSPEASSPAAASPIPASPTAVRR
jgi:hypothetical protein